MDCYISYQSPWMRKKVLDYLQNLLMRYKERISDDDIFIPLECAEAEKILTDQLCKLPKHLIAEIGLNGTETPNLEHLPKYMRKRIKVQMDESSLRCTLGSLWNKKPSKRQ